jgi:hypothetical protein
MTAVTQVHPGLSRRERKLRLASLLVLLGIVIEALSFVRLHPLAFLGFLAFGGLAIAAGVVLYLLSLLDTDSST